MNVRSLLRTRRFRLVAWLTGLTVVAGSCDRATAPVLASLRIYNAGSAPLTGLRVGFPDAEVSFGDVPAGATTGYRVVSGGVYRYAAYRFVHEGDTIGQPVEDWFGEVPMRGERFTYTLALNPASGSPPTIDLLGVAKDP